MGQGVVGAAEAIHCKGLELGTTDSLITIAKAMLQDEGLILEREPSQLTSLLWGEAVWGEAVWGDAVWGEAVWGDAVWGDAVWGEISSGEIPLTRCPRRLQGS
jgi:hypothetical protein